MIFRSFAGKMWLTIVAWVFLVVLIFGGILAKSTHDFYYGYEAEENEELTNTAANLSAYLATLPSVQTASVHFDFLGNLLKYDLVATDTQGHVLLGTHRLRDWTGFVMPAEDMAQIKQGRNISFEGSVPYVQQHIIKDATPIWQNNKVIGAVFVFEPFTHLISVSKSINHSIGWGLTLSFLLAIPLGIFVAKKMASPVVEMDKAVKDIATGNYGRLLALDSTPELASLGKSVNSLSEEIKLQLDEISRDRRQLANILTSMEDGVLTLSPAQDILIANRVALLQFAKIQEPNTLTLADLPEAFRKLLQEASPEATPSRGEFTWRDQVYSVEISSMGTEQEPGLVAVWHDITKERRLDEMRREFVANVSHELRTPLSYVQGYTEALLDDVVQDEQQRLRYLQTILNETLRLRRLVNDLLDLSRIEFGGPKDFPHEKVEVPRVIESICQQINPAAQQKHVAIVVDLAENLQPVDCGQDKLKQILLNLVDNALRHSPEHTDIRIAAKLSEPWIEISVADQGPGIPREEQALIWQRFVRASNGRNKRGSTGLGLAIVKSLVAAYQGEVDLVSTPGQGAAFYVRLPVFDPVQPPPVDTPLT